MTTAVRTYQRDSVTLYHADCRVLLPQLVGHGITTLLTDPPFHGREYILRREEGLNEDAPQELLAWQRFQVDWTRQWLTPMLRLLSPWRLGWLFAAPELLPAFLTAAYTAPWPVRRIWTRPECFGLILLTERILAAEACNELAWTILVNGYEPPGHAAPVLDLILSLCGPEDVVLDPFAGAGAGFLRRARAHGLRCIGIESDAEAFDAAVAALEAA